MFNSVYFSGKILAASLILGFTTFANADSGRNFPILLGSSQNTLLSPTPVPMSIMADQENVVHVSAVKDFPAPYQGVIKLQPNKMYIVSGMVNIGINAINLNGAGMKGMDPGKDGVLSAVNGAILRSREVDVYLESFCVVNASTETKAYEFTDVSGNKFLNLFAGCSVIDAPNIQSLGVGMVTGFNTICMFENYWKTRDGIKLSGSIEKFTSTLNYVTGITNGAAIEILANANIKDIIIQSCYFVYSGQVGLKVEKGALVDQARLSMNLFRGVGKMLEGVTSFTPGWEMHQNGEGVLDSKGYGFMYLSENTAPTGFKGMSLYAKILGQTKMVKSDKFITDQANKFTFTGKRATAFDVTAIVSATSPDELGSYSIVIMKNGKEIIAPHSTVSNLKKDAGFQIYLQTQVELHTGDFIEVFMKNNTHVTPVIVSDLQLKVSE